MKEQMNKLGARKMTTVYFIKWILVVCVALDSNKNLQKSLIYKNVILSCLSLLFYFFNKMYFFPNERILSTSDFHHTMQLTEKTNIFFFVLNICISFFFKYTTYTTFIIFFLQYVVIVTAIMVASDL